MQDRRSSRLRPRFLSALQLLQRNQPPRRTTPALAVQASRFEKRGKFPRMKSRRVYPTQGAAALAGNSSLAAPFLNSDLAVMNCKDGARHKKRVQPGILGPIARRLTPWPLPWILPSSRRIGRRLTSWKRPNLWGSHERERLRSSTRNSTARGRARVPSWSRRTPTSRPPGSCSGKAGDPQGVPGGRRLPE